MGNNLFMKNARNFNITIKGLLPTVKVAIKGFSLIELMVTVGIIAIVTGVVSVTYPTYAAKSQTTSVMTVLESYVKNAQSYYIDHNTNNNGFANISTALGTYSTNTATSDVLDSISITSNTPAIPESVTFTATFNSSATAALRNQTLTLTMTANNGLFTITCNSLTIPNNYLPSSCQTPKT